MAKTENQQHYGMAKYAQVAYSKTIRNRMSHCVNLAKAGKHLKDSSDM